MKKIKKLVFLLTAALLATTMLAGCGSKFDASAYLKAILDNSYKHDSSKIVELGYCTEEEAEEIYQEGIDNNISELESSVTLSDELMAGYEALFQKVYANADYTVGEAQKQEDNSYIVPVTYKPMNLFSDVEAAFEEQVTAYTDDLYEKAANGELDVTDQDALTQQMMNDIMQIYLDLLNDACDSMTYGDEATLDIRIELEDKVYTPNEDDLLALESAILAIESIE